eukprot:16442496-Heterocapsa_arctica.AAC.1
MFERQHEHLQTTAQRPFANLQTHSEPSNSCPETVQRPFKHISQPSRPCAPVCVCAPVGRTAY